MISKTTFVAVALLMGLASSTGAMAQEQCSCTTPISTAPNGGTLSPTGNVTLTSALGMVQVSQPSSLPVNSQFNTAAASGASYVIGGCSASVGAQTSVRIIQQGNDICVVDADISLPIVPIVGGVAVGGGAILLLSTGVIQLSD